ncbi:unnamed protein product [Ascophyllum nodosum]
MVHDLCRVFWIGPLLGGVLATVMWEAILRPEQPVYSVSTEKQAVPIVPTDTSVASTTLHGEYLEGAQRV